MKTKWILFVWLTVAGTAGIAQPGFLKGVKEDKKLTEMLRKAVDGFHGGVGVYVRNLKTNRIAGFQADSIFPTASMIKVPILCGIFDKMNKGEVSYSSVLTYRDSLHYDNGVIGSLRDSSRIPISYVIMQMITLSDNTGSLWLQAMSGGGETINQWLDESGFSKIRVNSRTPGRKQGQATYGWGQTSPAEMAELVAMIREGRAVSPSASEKMYQYLGRQFWDGEALSQLPPYVKAASKGGAVNRAKSEVVLVHAPHGEYVFCVATKDQADSRWGISNEGNVLLRKISALLWHYFEPRDRWQPAEGHERWYH